MPIASMNVQIATGCSPASMRQCALAQVTFAGDMFGVPSSGGSDIDAALDGGPWSSLEEYVSELGEEWAHDPNHNATCAAVWAWMPAVANTPAGKHSSDT